MAITQPRAAGAFTGRRYGSFAGRGAGAHPVDVLTQPRAFASFTGKRYGSFAGRGGGAGPHPVGLLTQPAAFGSHTMRRYGSFAGRTAAIAPAPGPDPGSMRMRLPRELLELQRARRITGDDVLLLLAASIAAGLVH